MPITGEFHEFNEDNIARAHATSGVYALYYRADDNAPVYIGRASGTGVTIRSRLRAHKSGTAGECTRRALWFKQEFDSFPVARERQLIDEYRHAHAGQLPRCNDVSP